MKTSHIKHIEISRWDDKSSSVSFVPSFYDYRPEQFGFSVKDHKET